MSLSKKFFILFLVSILFITITNIVAFYSFYNIYLKVYLAENIKTKNQITLDYINSIIAKQTTDEVDDIFNNTEIEFFDLLESNNGKIDLEKSSNRDIVTNYLIKSGLTPKYIEEILPTDNFSKVVEKIKDINSPEYKFLNRLLISIILTNLTAILVIIIWIAIFTKSTVGPIKNITKIIKNLDLTKKTNPEIVYTKQDEIGLLVGAINDLNRKLQIQEGIKSKLLADISHELKTPITSIQCYLEGISDGVIKLDEKTLNSIIEEMKRLIILVNKIMEYEKFDNQDLNVKLQEEDLPSLVKEIANTHKKRLEENNQRIKITGLINTKLKLDKNLFKQLVHNIISNFLKYAGQGSNLTINITKNYIEFADNGKGIQSNEIQFITEKFYQGKAEEMCNIREKGIGLGLNLIQKIIEAHNWTYKIKSDIDKGFSIKIYY
ncbi:MAG: HAMP domain-containing sensor histidine kinase [Candidatus Gracilibacteria bacterium]|nr:HAMP domain-containing sensor histidine kinase [Candidatus Gracilibacteria bacterium]